MPVERKPFEGDFLFVNHNAKQMKASPNRRQVFSHVQNQYRNWKRQQENRALRASIKALPHIPDASPSASTSTSSEVPVLDVRHTSTVKSAEHAQWPEPVDYDVGNQQRTSTKIAIRSLINDNDDDNDMDYQQQQREHLPERAEQLVAIYNEADTKPLQRQSLMTILGKGNSDPFGAYAVDITPAANDLLSFHRDFVIPALYHTTKHRWMTSASAWRDWRDCIDGLGDGVDGLGDEGAGSGFIASCATEAAVISLNPSVRKQAAYYRAKSMAVLHKRLMTGRFNRRQLYWHINLLVGTDTLTGDLVSTGAHLNMLRWYFEHDDQEKPVDTDLLVYILYHDVHRSSMFLCKPIFDVDNWLPQRLQPVIDAAGPYLPPNLSDVRRRFLDPSIDNPRLRTLLIERRESLAVWLFQNGSGLGTTDEDSSASHTTAALMGWLLVRVYLHQGQLVNLFLQAKEAIDVRNTNTSETPRSVNSVLCQGYLALATLLYIRAISFNGTVGGVRLFDATPTILANMRELLQLSERSPDTVPDHEKYENARLWALYVGATAESSMDTDMKLEEEEARRAGWFTTHLATKAIRLGLVRWDDVRNILMGFLYTDTMHPDGMDWFSRVLQSTARTN
ncbi:hypothetical protein Z517_00214 [Fonsecaea pedrosoi CBS 271.37]|uniref:Unplaced genomic scaffold supercont1.1, whole genome shotgun sequence n=1 Tax=Fonsecaea pedrosoi CBS 271.37 TaxID=1442368 RepID=A0A0D2E411_9EURO|nr:uncharacterized protein Z517_00214 [Fonsecaea pedrosoi CBS 271.37]KIW84826.1 hypothetical protein Z517_00214 [Fonsecaea pedrosoi CBS 271.37]